MAGLKTFGNSMNQRLECCMGRLPLLHGAGMYPALMAQLFPDSRSYLAFRARQGQSACGFIYAD